MPGGGVMLALFYVHSCYIGFYYSFLCLGCASLPLGTFVLGKKKEWNIFKLFKSPMMCQTSTFSHSSMVSWSLVLRFNNLNIILFLKFAAAFHLCSRSSTSSSWTLCYIAVNVESQWDRNCFLKYFFNLKYIKIIYIFLKFILNINICIKILKNNN
jgi:hypothetical protein